MESDSNRIPTRWGPLQLAPALPHDLPLVQGILDEAAARLLRAGIDQWRPGSWPIRDLECQAEAGEIYLAWLGTEAAATLTIQWSDVFFWGERPPDAGYVHRLALPDRWIGLGIGRSLLAWAEGRVHAADRPFLRLDCMAENPRIRAYYEDAGFMYRGEIGATRWRAALYEKVVDTAPDSEIR